MTRILIGLIVSFFGDLCDLYPAYLRRTAVEVDSSKRSLQMIKSPADALTLSRFMLDGQVHTLAVLEDDGEHVTGVDISVALNHYDRNSFDVIQNLHFNDVVNIINNSSRKVAVNYRDLLPCVEGTKHIAIGINYKAHGEETGQIAPFMFPKFAETDPAIHQLNYTPGWLLDHEVELGIVFPSMVCSSADLERLRIGFLVVNDFTDRATLMRKMDSKNVISGKGFPDAKSGKGFLPTGPYMVIPRDWSSFVKELQLGLSVNGAVRQGGYAKDMVWNINRIIEESLASKGEKNWSFQDRPIALFDSSCIPANSIVITGTPSGVVFNAPPKSFIIEAVTKYLFTGKFLGAKMHPYILQQYLKKEMKNERYLKPGDYIESSISFLGKIRTTVTK